MIAEQKPLFTSKHHETLNLYLHIIAHEIRSPLVAIQGYANLLREQFGNSLPQEGQEYLTRIESNLNRAESLLAAINKLAKVAINEANFRRVSIEEIVCTALESHEIQLQRKGLTLRVQPDMPDLYCDSDSLILVFSNLIGNAIKYSRRQGGGQIEIGYLNDEIFHKFFVKDDGVGFKSQDRVKIFHLFRRLRNKKDVSGTGLGLCIVKQIIAGHGGEVWVESRLNRGATFFFTLPKNIPNLPHYSL